MGRALFLADKARTSDDVPVGAVVLDSTGRIIGQGWNQREIEHDPSAHAEILALREAGRHLGRWNLVGCTLVVTLEPCTMCAGAAVQARLDRVVFAAWDPKAGAAGSVRDVLRDSRLNHQVEVIGGVLEEEAAVQLRRFFEDRRSDQPGRAEPAPAPAPAAPSVGAWSRTRSWETSTRATPASPNATSPRTADGPVSRAGSGAASVPTATAPTASARTTGAPAAGARRTGGSPAGTPRVETPGDGASRAGAPGAGGSAPDVPAPDVPATGAPATGAPAPDAPADHGANPISVRRHRQGTARH